MWGEEIGKLWAEGTRHRHVVELLIGPLHASKQRAKGVGVYLQFLRSLRDAVGERAFAKTVLERACKLLDESRTVMPALPELLSACERAQREHSARVRSTAQQVTVMARQGGDPAIFGRTEALRRRLRNRLSQEVAREWFGEIHVQSFADGCLTLSAGSQFKRSWITSHLYEPLLECAKAEFPGLKELRLEGDGVSLATANAEPAQRHSHEHRNAGLPAVSLGPITECAE